MRSPNDVVVLYLACHGGPDSRQPLGALYFLTHDTERSDVAGTGVPMDEIDRLLRLLPDRRVVIIADTCHSAGVVGMPGARDGTPVAEITNQYLGALGRTGAGVALLTSAESSEVSREDERWGGGHGVFTHFLLDGMRGAADGADGPRTASSPWASSSSTSASGSRPRPTARSIPSLHTAQAARLLPLAVTGTAELDHRVALAELSLQVGWLLGERGPFVAAAALADEASMIARLADRSSAELDALRGRALVAAGQSAGAVPILAPLAAASEAPPPSVLLASAVALAETGDPDAADALDRFAAAAPADPDAPWATAWASWLRRPPSSAVHGLLIGISQYEQPAMSLRGPVADVADLQRTLVDVLGAAPENLRVLLDADATADATDIGASQNWLEWAEKAGSSSSTSADTGAARWTRRSLPGVRRFAEGRGSLTPRQLGAALDELPESTLVVLDTHLSEGLQSVLVARPATALVACGPGENAVEAQIEGQYRARSLTP